MLRNKLPGKKISYRGIGLNIEHYGELKYVDFIRNDFSRWCWDISH